MTSLDIFDARSKNLTLYLGKEQKKKGEKKIRIYFFSPPIEILLNVTEIIIIIRIY